MVFTLMTGLMVQMAMFRRHTFVQL